MIEANVERIKWYLDFINLKIEDLEEGERLKWIQEILYMRQFGVPHIRRIKYLTKGVTSSAAEVLKWNESEKLACCHTKLKEFLEKLTAKIDKTRSEKSKPTPANKYKFENNFSSFDTNITITIQAPGTVGDAKEDGKQWYRWVEKEKMDDAPLHMALHTGAEEMDLLLLFCQSLEGIKIGFIRKCPVCGEWFLHVTKKKKLYCSNRCAARQASKSRRERIKREDPDKYKEELIKARARSTKSHKKKRIEEYGENVVIQRRIRKK